MSFFNWFTRSKHPDDLLKEIYELVKIRSRRVALYKRKGWSYKKVFIDIKNVYSFEEGARSTQKKNYKRKSF